MSDGEFFGFLLANIFWTITFFASMSAGVWFYIIIPETSELGEAVVGFFAATFLLAFGIAGLALMIGRIWPTWM